MDGQAEGLHGRDQERAAIDRLLDAARAGRGGALVLRGVAGAGKSALLADAVERSTDARVVRARGVASESELPFAALHQLLLPLADLIDELPGPQAMALRAAFGLDVRLPGGVEDRFLVCLATLALLSEAAASQPVVAAVDDAHWLDEASARVLLFVARRLEREPIALLFAARERDEGFDPIDLPELVVPGLDHAAARAVLSARAGVPVTRDVVDRLVEATGGNALALSELPDALGWERLAGLQPLPASLPLTGGVERAFSERVRALPEPTRWLLLLAAADDAGELASVLAAAASTGAAAADLAPAERAGLVTISDGSVQFRHPLVRSAAYAGAPTAERWAAHLALAEVVDPDRRAWHRAAATTTPDESVVAELDQAAARARARGAYEAGGAALERAAELSVDEDGRAKRLVVAAELAWLAGQPSRAAGLASAARATGSDLLVHADADRLRGIVELASGSAVGALRLLVDAAREVAAADPSRAVAMVALAAEAASLAADTAAAVDLGRLVAQLPIGGGAEDRVAADVVVGLGHHFAGDRGAGVEVLRRAIGAATKAAQPDLLATAGRVAFYVGDDELTYRLNAEVIATARAAGALGDVLPSLSRLALIEVLTGRWTSAEGHLAEISRLGRDVTARATATSETFGQLAALSAGARVPLGYGLVLAAYRGDDRTFETLLARVEGTPDPLPGGGAADTIEWARAAHELAAGRHGAALVHVGRLRHPVTALHAGLDAVEAAARAGDEQTARAWVEELDDHAHTTGAAWALARAAHGRALLSSGDEATALFEAALGHHETASRPFERARALLALGEHLRRARRRVDARAHLRAALEAFEHLDAAPWAERARNELRASGETARRRVPSTMSQLTPQERQVARFVAQGLPNRDVAAQLFVSPRTVDFHLRNVFTKLGVTSRTELARRSLD